MTRLTARAATAEGVTSSEPRGGARFPRSARLGSEREIRRVLHRGRRVGGPFVDLHVAPTSPGAPPRVAVIVPRHGHTAVARNRVRRRLREIARREWLPRARRAASPLDLVMRARPAAYERSYAELRSSLGERLESLCSER